MSAPNSPLDEARRRIADCFHGRDEQGRLIQRRDALNLAGLGLTAEEIEERFVWNVDPEPKRRLGKSPLDRAKEFFGGSPKNEPERHLGEIGFEDLIHLRYLDLTSNKLDRLPRGTRRIDGLRWLGLNFNQLTSIASEAGDWKELQRLYLRGNKLRTLPESVAIWGSLEEVDLAENVPLECLPRVWLDVLARKRSSNADASEIVVELAGSGLATAFEKETGTKLTRDNFHEAAVQEWLSRQQGEPEHVDIRRPNQRDIRGLVKEWGEAATADALASLALRKESWLFFLENPASLGQRLVEEDDLKEIRAEVSRIRALSTSPSFVHPLWRAWYVTGLRRWRQEGEDRWKRMRDSVAARSPSGLGNPTVEAETGEQTPPPQASSDLNRSGNGGAPSGRAGRQRKTK